VTSREELVGFRPAREFSYRALSGLPIRDHRADVELSERDGGTAITWHEDFVAARPGSAGYSSGFCAGSCCAARTASPATPRAWPPTPRADNGTADAASRDVGAGGVRWRIPVGGLWSASTTAGR